MLPGIEGQGLMSRQIVEGLDRGKVPYALEVYDWTTGIAPLFLTHQMDRERNQVAAEGLAKRVQEYAEAYPGRPIWLVGLSGGGGIAVFALEALPVGFDVEGAVLIAPSLSREYDLSRALEHVRTKMYHYYSPSDLVFLGFGTLAFGTMDRIHGESAGRRGFVEPTGLTQWEQGLYVTHLEQVRRSEGGLAFSALHVTSANPIFIERVVAPHIRPADGRYPVPEAANRR